ncbi:unnamed protein product, partial [Rotaria sp. Silwood1]
MPTLIPLAGCRNYLIINDKIRHEFLMSFIRNHCPTTQLRTRHIKMLILDEADEMLNLGFKEQIYEVYRHLPPQTQVILVSATLPHEILEITTKFMTDPIRILVKRDELTLEGIKQFFVAVEREEWK